MYFKVYKLKFLLALLLLPFMAMAQPAGWTVTETPLTHAIIVPDGLPLSVNGIAVENGDFIGVFFDDGGTMVCGGYVELGAGPNNNFVAFGEFVGTPGFSFGEAFAWRFYDSSTGTEYLTDATYSAGSNVWDGSASTLESFVQGFSIQAFASPSFLCAAGDVTLNAVSLDPVAFPVDTWEWFIGATSVSNAQSFVYSLTETTTFMVVATDGIEKDTAYVTVVLSGVFAGNYDGGCASVPVPILLDLATASPDLVGINWATSGTGTFDNINLLNATYTPSLGDFNNGSVTLTLSGISLACGPVSDDVTITFQMPPTVDLPEFVFTCVPTEVDPDPVDFAGLVTATNYGMVQWVSINSVSNLFTPNDQTLEPVFYPSPTDVSLTFDQGYEPTRLVLAVDPIAPCTVGTSDTVAIYYVRPPAVDAGDPYGFCIDPLVTSYTFSGASVAFDNNPALAPVVGSINNTILWTTDGDGGFDDATLANPTYTFGANDLLGGVINFTVTAQTDVACGPVSSNTTITVQAPPSIDIIPDTYTICEGDSMNFIDKVIGANYASLQWYTTNGNGIWSNDKVLEPIYYPSPTDILQFSELGLCTELWVAAAAINPCVVSDEDMMLLCYQLLPVVVAGENDTICSNETFTTNATVENSNGPYMWTHNGNGYFEDPTMLNATYVAVPADAGTDVTLTLTAGPIGPCSVAGEGSMILTILCAPDVYAGEDITVCETENPVLTGVVECVSDWMWATTGDGFFCCPQDLITTYYPGPGDLAGDGCVTLVLIGYPLEPCTMYELDKVVVCFDKAPVVDAGPDMTVCEGEPVQLDGTSANVCGLQWVTFDGTGTFSNENIDDPIYLPSFQDFISGTVHLIFIGAPCGDACTEAAIDTMALTIQPAPVIDLGEAEATICENGTYTSIATATNYSSLLWTTGGDGTFDDATILNATYTPGPGDIATEGVILTLTAEAIGPCATPTSANILINIQVLPSIDILPDTATICYGDQFDFTGKVAGSNINAIQWFTTNGAGFFTPNENVLEPTYNPSPIDYLTGCIQIGVVVSPILPCVGVAAIDTMILCFQPPVNIVIADTALICEDATYTPAPYLIENGCGVLWTTDGDGAFDNAALEYPVYTPGVADLAAGSVNLHVTGIGCSTCEDFTADVHLMFQLNPVANAGPDGVVCEHLCLPPWTNGQFQLNGSVTNASGQMWTSAGDGAFNDASLLNAVYTVGDGDIANGSVELCLTAAPIDPCTVSDTDCMTLSIQYFPIADAGPDQSICEGESAQMDGTTTFASGVFWDFAFYGEGDGTWSNQLIEDPVYTPGADDIDRGWVELIMVAFPISPCTYPDADIMTLYIIQQPVANAGPDGTICLGETFPLTGASVENATGGVLWTTTGTGTFDPANNVVNPTYVPGAGEIGVVTLCLEAIDGSACTAGYSDCMELTILEPPTANAGPDATICETDTFTTNPVVSNFSSVLWTSSGTGLFDDNASAIATYTPSAADIAAGSVELCIEVFSLAPCNITVSDCMVLTFQLSPVITPMDDMTVCETELPFCFDATAVNYASLLWSTNGTGTFADATIEDACYTPSAADIAAGSVELCLTAQPIDPCTVAAQECFIFTIQQGPVVEPLADATICEYDLPFLIDATASNYSSLLWTSSGTGTFDFTNVEDVAYTASAADILAGFVDLCLTAQPIDPCTVAATECMTLTFQLSPVITPMDDMTVCETELPFCFNATAANYASLLWSTSGTGTFADATVEDACYTPSAADIAAGSVELCLTAQPIAPCAVAAQECFTFTIQQGPFVDAGADAAICQGSNYQLAGSANFTSSVMWSGGLGSFDDATLLNATYTPALGETGLVVLTLTGYPMAPCTAPATDVMVLTIQEVPFVDAGADATICQGSNYQLAGSANFTSSVMWSGGLGSFDDATLLNATYTPALGETGLVQLTLTGYPMAPCADSTTDVMVLTIQDGPFVDAGADATICQGSNYQLAGSANFTSSVMWSGGLGSFDDATLLNATYTPALGETGSVVLTLTGYPIAPCADPATDVMVLTIQEVPFVDAGADAAICEGSNYQLAGSANFTSSVMWSGGLGSFDDATLLNATYTPALGETGPVVLTLTGYPMAPCTAPATDVMVLTIQEGPFVDAGPDATICQGSNYQLAGSANFASSVMWSGGLGSFDDAALLNATYTPAPGETGLVQLTLTGYPMAPCTAPATDVMVLTIQPIPVVNAGADMTVCDNVLTIDLLATASNYTSISWSGGNGFFDDDASLATFYNVVAQDVIDGSITLCLTAVPVGPCQDIVVDCLTITFDPSPGISDLQNATICEGGLTYCFAGVTATNYSSLLWTGGDGSFDDDTALNPCYTPGPADVLAGQVILTLTAQPMGGCTTPAVDAMTLFIVADPTIALDPEMNLTCADYDFVLEQWLPIGLNPVVANALSVTWETSGDGFFDNPAAALTSYNIGPLDDKWNGSVTLSITAYGDANCGVIAKDSIIIYIPQQIIEVVPGTVWRGISSYVDKSTTSVADVMQPVVVVPGSQSLVIMIDKSGKYFWPEPIPAINQLGLWQPIGYKAKFKAEGCLPIYGDVAYDTVAHNFAVSGAFSYVPCLTNYAVDINTLFAGHFNDILLIYSWEDGTLWVPPPVISPLQFIRPGSAYLMVNKIGVNYSVTFPPIDLTASIVAKAVVPPAGTDFSTPWNAAVNTSQPHFILFADEVIGSMQVGDIVGAFNQYDECVGTTEIDVRNDMIKLLAMGDDPSTEVIDGYEDGENMMFKLYRPSTDETFEVTFTYDANYPSYDNKFEVYGVSKVAGMTMTLTSVNELVVDRNINVYPNPANEVINIASDYDLRKVTLVNYVGQTVFSQVVDGNNFQINVSTFVNGMYFVRIETAQGSIITKPISIQ